MARQPCFAFDQRITARQHLLRVEQRQAIGQARQPRSAPLQTRRRCALPMRSGMRERLLGRSQPLCQCGATAMREQVKSLFVRPQRGHRMRETRRQQVKALASRSIRCPAASSIDTIASVFATVRHAAAGGSSGVGVGANRTGRQCDVGFLPTPHTTGSGHTAIARTASSLNAHGSSSATTATQDQRVDLGAERRAAPALRRRFRAPHCARVDDHGHVRSAARQRAQDIVQRRASS